MQAVLGLLESASQNGCFRYHSNARCVMIPAMEHHGRHEGRTGAAKHARGSLTFSLMFVLAGCGGNSGSTGGGRTGSGTGAGTTGVTGGTTAGTPAMVTGGTTGTTGGTTVVAGAGGAAGTVAGSAGSAGAGGGTPVSCPAMEPADGAACTGEGLCSYGDQPDCRTVWECWGGRFSQAAKGACAGAADCPVDSASGVCANGTPAGVCAYPDGSSCRCESPCGGIPPPPDLRVWICRAAPPAACHGYADGQPCPKEDLTCGDASCGGEQATCTGGVWHVSVVPPPP